MKRLNNKNGFTLVELLVVLAIVGVLVGLAIAGMRIVQQVSRDTQRKAFISKDVQLLLEAHQERKNEYPDSIKVTRDDPECADGETYIETFKSGTTTAVEKGCSKVGFDTTITPCDTTFKEEVEGESGNLTMCYSGAAKGYELKVKLERNNQPYNAGNVEL